MIRFTVTNPNPRTWLIMDRHRPGKCLPFPYQPDTALRLIKMTPYLWDQYAESDLDEYETEIKTN